MGNAFYSLSDDEYALFFNPAGLAYYRGRPHVTLVNGGLALSDSAFTNIGSVVNSATGGRSLNSLASQIYGAQGSSIYAGTGLFPYFLKKKFALGLLIGDTKMNTALLGSGAQATLDVTAISDTGIFLGWADKVSRHWNAGITTKAVYRIAGRNAYTLDQILGTTPFTLSTYQQGGSGFALDADLGAIYDISDPWIGDRAGLSFSLNNALGTFLISSGPSPPPLPRMASAGVFCRFEDRKHFEYWAFRLDASEFALGGLSDPDFGARYGALIKHLNAGTEIKLSPWLLLRGGIHQGDWTAGLGVVFPGIHFDFATYGEELGADPGAVTSRRYAIQISLGFEIQGNRVLFVDDT
jgi:hypothetical protein